MLLCVHRCVRFLHISLALNMIVQVLDLSNNRIGHISGLDNLPLRELNLSGNNLYTLHGLDHVPTLSVLDVSRNHITCLAPLRNCTHLTYLDAQRNDISLTRQVEFLGHMQWLRTLVMMENVAANKPFYRCVCDCKFQACGSPHHLFNGLRCADIA